MKVKQLIKELQKLDQDADVIMGVGREYGFVDYLDKYQDDKGHKAIVLKEG